MLKWATDSLEQLDRVAASTRASTVSKEGEELEEEGGEGGEEYVRQPAAKVALRSAGSPQGAASAAGEAVPGADAAAPPSSRVQELGDAAAALGGWQQPELQAEFEALEARVAAAEGELEAEAGRARELEQRRAVQAAVFAQELAHLEADLGAGQVAYGSGRSAAADLRAQNQARAEELTRQLAAYTEALATTHLRLEEKRAEGATVAEREAVGTDELAGLQAEVQAARTHREQREAAARALEDAEPAAAPRAPGHEGATEGGEAASREAAELQARLEEQEAEVARLELHLADSRERQARWPSEAARVSDMERRLVGLRDQLAAKQRQMDIMTNEKAQIQMRLEGATSQRRRLQRRTADDASAAKRRVSEHGPTLPVTTSDKAPGAGAHKFEGSGLVTAHLAGLANALDGLGLLLGRHLRRNIVLRLSLVAYVCCLHLIALVIIYFDLGMWT